jgi:YD repeat-containing protein
MNVSNSLLVTWNVLSIYVDQEATVVVSCQRRTYTYSYDNDGNMVGRTRTSDSQVTTFTYSGLGGGGEVNPRARRWSPDHRPDQGSGRRLRGQGFRFPVFFLVPKLCLGTQSAKLRFARRRNRVSWECVPKQSLGTRRTRSQSGRETFAQ